MKTEGFHHSEQGMTLVETIVALVIFLIILGFMIPLFAKQRINTIKNEIETGAVTVSQQIMDELRQTNITTLPNSGSTTALPSGESLTSISVMNKVYSATIFYCETAVNCSSGARHIRVQVNYNGQTVYQVTTVYTQVQ